jgi:MSHA pilin protein MshC
LAVVQTYQVWEVDTAGSRKYAREAVASLVFCLSLEHFVTLQHQVDSWFEGILDMHLSVGQARVIKHETGHFFDTQANAWLPGSCVKNQRGFTLVELITVMVIAGILAVAAIPRFIDHASFDSRAFYDRTISTLRYAQKLAIAQRRFVCVEIAGNVITLTYDETPRSATHTVATCPGSALTSPATGATPYTIAAPSGVTVDAATFNFDALGSTTAQSIAVSGYGDVIVEAGTGYVH